MGLTPRHHDGPLVFTSPRPHNGAKYYGTHADQQPPAAHDSDEPPLLLGKPAPTITSPRFALKPAAAAAAAAAFPGVEVHRRVQELIKEGAAARRRASRASRRRW